MPNIDNLRNSIVTEFYDNSVMLNVAMNIEYLLCEEVILYPYKNWSLGELISGPYIKRYMVDIILRYDYEEMPDPEGALVLKKFGIQTTYRKLKDDVIDDEESEKQGKKVTKNVDCWYIKLSFPRDLVTDENQRQNLDMVDQMVDLEALETAADENMEEDSVFDDFGGQEDFEMGDEMDEMEEPEEMGEI